MAKKPLQEDLKVPEGVALTCSSGKVTLKGKKGEHQRDFFQPLVQLQADGQTIQLRAIRTTKREKKMAGTIIAHLKNMIIGVTEGHSYKLKICSGHFPMNVSVSPKEFIIKNFLGEKYPRILQLKPGVMVKIDGQDIIVESVDKEKAGQVAADIETLTKVKGRDLRIFQDGIYITTKDGKSVR